MSAPIRAPRRPLVSLLLAAALAAAACRSIQDDDLSTFDTAPVSQRFGDFQVLLGVRELEDHAAWGDLEDQSSAAVIWSREPPGSLVGWEVALLGSWQDTTVRTPNGPEKTVDLNGSLFEASLGMVKSVLLGGVVRPYVGLGIELLHVEFETPLDGTSEVLSDHDEMFGVYGRAGILLQWTESSYIGVDVRGLEGPSESVLDVEYDPDYLQVSIVFGASF